MNFLIWTLTFSVVSKMKFLCVMIHNIYTLLFLFNTHDILIGNNFKTMGGAVKQITQPLVTTIDRYFIHLKKTRFQTVLY